MTTRGGTTRTIPAGEFKAHCLRLMDEVNENNLTLIVTKRGKPVIRVTAPPFETRPFTPVWRRTPGARIPEEILAPPRRADPVEKWDRVEQQIAAHGPAE